MTVFDQVKFYGWEAPLAARVRVQRLLEASLLRRSGVVKTLALMSVFAVPVLVALAMFGSVVALGTKPEATLVFTALSMFNTLRVPLLNMPRAVRAVASALTAIENVQKFLLLDEIDGVVESGVDVAPKLLNATKYVPRFCFVSRLRACVYNG